MLSTWHMGTLSSDCSTAYLSLVSISKQNLLSMDSVFLLTQYFRVKSKVPWYKRGLIGSLNKNVQKLFCLLQCPQCHLEGICRGGRSNV